MEVTASVHSILQNLRKSQYPLVQLKAMNYVVKEHLINEEIYDELVHLLGEKDVPLKIFGQEQYVLSDYAFATLFLLNDKVTLERYLREIRKATPAQKERVRHLIESPLWQNLG